MNLEFHMALADRYHSKSQSARVLTENWVLENMFCPRCGSLRLEQFANNSPVADFFCPQCDAQYELKSKTGKIGDKVNDGAYQAMIERITSKDNTDFFFMSYSRDSLSVKDFILIPKHFFLPEIIEKRKPLSPTARRAGWTGCNILLSKVPAQGRISIIHNGYAEKRDSVIEKMKRAKELNIGNLEARGWLMDILNCINSISSNEFALTDIYSFEGVLANKYPDNNNIRPKIRQQLQLLQDKGFIEFCGRGRYKKNTVY